MSSNDVPPELADLLKPVGDITRKEPLVVIKTEPVDDDDIEQPVPVVGQPKRRKLSPEEYLARSQSIESRSSEGSNRSQDPVPGSHFQAVSPTYPNVPQPGPSWSRDPRLQRGNSNDQLRQAFLNRQLSAENIINATEKDASCPQSAVLRNAYHLARDGHELLTQASHAPRSFHAVIPSGHLLPGGYEQKRSPLIASNHNSLFVCQATAANIGDALAGQRYRKIPQDLQATGQTLGVDLDRVASGMGRDHTDNKRRMTTETSFAVNKRTIGMQSDPSQTEDRETQTTKNTEAFEYFIPNVRALTQKQRDALAVFKEEMGIVDDLSTDSIQERLQHRRARQNLDVHLHGNGRAPVFNQQLPFIAGPPPSKYANAVPNQRQKDFVMSLFNEESQKFKRPHFKKIMKNAKKMPYRP